MAGTPDSMNMSWEFTGEPVQFAPPTQPYPVTWLVEPQPPRKRTFSDYATTAREYTAKFCRGTCHYTGIIAVQAAQYGKRRFINFPVEDAPDTQVPTLSSQRRTSPGQSRSSPIFRQDLTRSPGLRPTLPVTPPKFRHNATAMPGTWPATPGMPASGSVLEVAALPSTSNASTIPGGWPTTTQNPDFSTGHTQAVTVPVTPTKQSPTPPKAQVPAQSPEQFSTPAETPPLVHARRLQRESVYALQAIRRRSEREQRECLGCLALKREMAGIIEWQHYAQKCEAVSAAKALLHVKFEENPVTRVKKYAKGETIDFPSPVSTVSDVASNESSPFVEHPIESPISDVDSDEFTSSVDPFWTSPTNEVASDDHRLLPIGNPISDTASDESSPFVDSPPASPPADPFSPISPIPYFPYTEVSYKDPHSDVANDTWDPFVEESPGTPISDFASDTSSPFEDNPPASPTFSPISPMPPIPTIGDYYMSSNSDVASGTSNSYLEHPTESPVSDVASNESSPFVDNPEEVMSLERVELALRIVSDDIDLSQYSSQGQQKPISTRRAGQLESPLASKTQSRPRRSFSRDQERQNGRRAERSDSPPAYTIPFPKSEQGDGLVAAEVESPSAPTVSLPSPRDTMQLEDPFLMEALALRASNMDKPTQERQAGLCATQLKSPSSDSISHPIARDLEQHKIPSTAQSESSLASKSSLPQPSPLKKQYFAPRVQPKSSISRSSASISDRLSRYFVSRDHSKSSSSTPSTISDRPKPDDSLRAAESKSAPASRSRIPVSSPTKQHDAPNNAPMKPPFNAPPLVPISIAPKQVDAPQAAQSKFTPASPSRIPLLSTSVRRSSRKITRPVYKPQTPIKRVYRQPTEAASEQIRREFAEFLLSQSARRKAHRDSLLERAAERIRKRSEDDARKRAEKEREEMRKKFKEESRKRAEEEIQEIHKKVEEDSRKKAAEGRQERRKKAERESRKKADEESRKKAEERTELRRFPTENVLQPLTPEWEMKIRDALMKKPSEIVARTCTGHELDRRDIGKVLPQRGAGDDPSGWLNDSIIDGYLDAVVEHGLKIRGHKRGETPKIHAFNTMFYKNIQERGVESVRRWTRRPKIQGEDLLKVEHVFIPVNVGGNHWTLLVISPAYKTIEYYDSLHGMACNVIRNAKRWLYSELGDLYKPDDWNVVEDPDLFPLRGKGPDQDNGSDCGVFTITSAKMISLGVDPMAISAEDMPLQRKRVVAELLNGGFHGDFEPRVVF